MQPTTRTALASAARRCQLTYEEFLIRCVLDNYDYGVVSLTDAALMVMNILGLYSLEAL